MLRHMRHSPKHPGPNSVPYLNFTSSTANRTEQASVEKNQGIDGTYQEHGIM